MRQKRGGPGHRGAGADLGGQGHAEEHHSAHTPSTSLPLLSICTLSLPRMSRRDPKNETARDLKRAYISSSMISMVQSGERRFVKRTEML